MAEKIELIDPRTGGTYRAGVFELQAGTDRSGTAGTAATTLAPANAARLGMEIQNISANTIGVNEIGGTAAIGSPGTFTVPANGTFSVRTNRAISIVASAANSAYTATER